MAHDKNSYIDLPYIVLTHGFTVEKKTFQM